MRKEKARYIRGEYGGKAGFRLLEGDRSLSGPSRSRPAAAGSMSELFISFASQRSKTW